MFNPFPPLAFAGAWTLPDRETSHNSTPKPTGQTIPRLHAMLGRGLGRGAPPVGAPAVGAPAAHFAPAPVHAAPSSALPPEFLDYVEAMGQNIAALREQLDLVRGEVGAIGARGSDSTRVFEALHSELGDYKRDFVFAHVKPLLRPLLFLFDSLENFDGEMALYEAAQSGQSLAPDALRATKVRGNIAFLRDQLVEALGVCEVEPMANPGGKFDPHHQKAIETAPVAPEHDGQIVRVIRGGWTLNGQLLRPAEVVVGKAGIGKSEIGKAPHGPIEGGTT